MLLLEVCIGVEELKSREYLSRNEIDEDGEDVFLGEGCRCCRNVLIGRLSSCVFLVCETSDLVRLQDIIVMIADDERIFLCHLGGVDRNCRNNVKNDYWSHL